jgi:hypothetical protein
MTGICLHQITNIAVRLCVTCISFNPITTTRLIDGSAFRILVASVKVYTKLCGLDYATEVTAWLCAVYRHKGFNDYVKRKGFDYHVRRGGYDSISTG